MTTVNIGLIGFGTIGRGVYYLLKKNRALIRERTGIDLSIVSVCDLRINDIKNEVSNIHLTSDWKEVVCNNKIDIVVELIGGIEPARSIILESINKGKDVVTANKKLLAEKGEILFETANRLQTRLEFEAAVGGGIPCIQALRDGLVGNRVNTIMGILNGTTNYILTRMEDENLSFDEALKDAQQKGFAESDPTFDIEGFDAGHKIAILSQLAFNKKISFCSISREGIRGISTLDITYAREMGYTIKLLGISKLIGDKVDIRIHPTMLPLKHPLSSVRDEFNAVMFFGDMTGPVILYGKGAGSFPTASAVISDIIQITEKGREKKRGEILDNNTEYIQEENRTSRYYIRLNSEDRPGILSRISGVLANHNISIASVIQKAKNAKYVPLVIMTHKSSETGILISLKEINDFDFVDGNIALIRVEDSSDIGENDA